jgi:SAM-dependent methyltransferase
VDLAADMQTDQVRTERALQTLVSVGYLLCEKGAFRTHPDTAPYLLTTSPQSFVQTFLGLSNTRHVGLDQIAELIEGAPCEGGTATFDAGHWQRQQKSLSTFHRAVAAQEMLQALEKLPEWSHARTILDVGGGSLELAKLVVSARLDVKIMLFDLPGLIESIGQPDESRILTCAGNYNDHTTLPDGPFDVLWCSMSLYFAEDLVKVMRVLQERLAPGGVLVSFHEDLTADRCFPTHHVIGRAMPALAGKDLSFSNGIVANTMDSIGLLGITSKVIETAFGPFRLDAGRKLNT